MVLVQGKDWVSGDLLVYAYNVLYLRILFYFNSVWRLMLLNINNQQVQGELSMVCSSGQVDPEIETLGILI